MTDPEHGASPVRPAAAIVEYQSDSIVSKVLVKSKSGSVTAFAFDASQELSEHTAPFDALVHVIDGAAEVLIDGEPHCVSSGETIVLPAHRPHAVKAVERFKMLLTMIRG